MYINLITVKGNYHDVLFRSRVTIWRLCSAVEEHKLFKYYLFGKMIKPHVCIVSYIGVFIAFIYMLHDSLKRNMFAFYIYIYICIALFFFKPYVSILVMLVKLNLFPKYICGNGKIFTI